MYDPSTARFLQPDPFGQDVDEPNAYQYCFNDPINLIDPDGLQPVIAPPPREAGSLWTTAPDGHEVGSFKCPIQTWSEGKDGKTICKADLTIKVFGYREFRTYRGDNSRGNFRVFVELRYIYTNVRCTEPCKPEMKEENFITHIWSRSMGNHIFVEGEVQTYTHKFKPPKDCDMFEENYLAGFYNLEPVPPPKK